MLRSDTTRLRYIFVLYKGFLHVCVTKTASGQQNAVLVPYIQWHEHDQNRGCILVWRYVPHVVEFLDKKCTIDSNTSNHAYLRKNKVEKLYRFKMAAILLIFILCDCTNSASATY